MKFDIKLNEKIVEILSNRGIGVLPTDTIYGLAGAAFSKEAIEKIYKLRRRSLKKPMIILISSLDDLNLFKVKVDEEVKKLLQKFWPGKVSIILPCPYEKFFYLHRGTKKLAFRVPALNWLRNLLKRTGPLVAPSANPEGLPHAQTIKKAKEYFGKNVDFYVSGGKLSGLASTLIEIRDKNIIIKRKGAGKIKI